MDPTPSVGLVATHPNAVEHFAEFTGVFDEYGVDWRVYTTEAMSEKFDLTRVHVVEQDSDLRELVEKVALHSSVIAGCGDPRNAILFTALTEARATTRKFVYYDNFSRTVPEPYPTNFAKIAAVSDAVLYAAKSHTERGVCSSDGEIIPVPDQRIGLGRYPLHDAKRILAFKQDAAGVLETREALFSSAGIEDVGQDVFIFIGGANKMYLENLKFFLNLLSEANIKNEIIILQRHPRAAKNGIKDAEFLKDFLETVQLPVGCSFIVSNNPDTAKVLSTAEGVIYADTSMAAQCAYANIPQVFRVYSEGKPDCMEEAGFKCPKTPEELAEAFAARDSETNKETLAEVLDLDPNSDKKLLQVAFLRPSE